MVSDIGVDIYRNDFNMHPLYYWRTGEAPDRQGMNEIRYVEGLYDYFDTLLREHPKLIIDIVASDCRALP
jgi:alpha-galactosidase